MSTDALPLFIIGRGDEADYRVDDAYASPRHAVIRAHGRGLFTVEDGGSTNGLWVRIPGSPRVRVYAPTPLLPAASVTVGRTEIEASELLRAFIQKVTDGDA